MIGKTKLVSALATLALAGAVPMASLAQQKPAQTAAPAKQASAKSRMVDHVAQGSVVSMSDTSMVVRITKNRDLTFAVNKDTEKAGDISSGKDVTVHYRNDKGQHVATSIQQTAALQKTPAAQAKKN